MILAVDIGNTTINLGIFKGERLVQRWAIPTQGAGTFLALKRIVKKHPVTDAVLCSVVPKATTRVVSQLENLIRRKPHVIGKEIRVPIKNLYRRPSQVGQDRLVNAYAGMEKFGAPLIVVDFGTAVTFDVISRNKEYLGGMILAGLQISLDILAERTALLPHIKLAKPAKLIGRDTRSSILSGIVFGMASMVDEVGLRLKETIGRNAKVILTGGNSILMGKFCRKADYVVPELTLKGLNMIYIETANF